MNKKVGRWAIENEWHNNYPPARKVVYNTGEDSFIFSCRCPFDRYCTDWRCCLVKDRWGINEGIRNV